MKRGAIFSDLDGTLCFHQELHGIRLIKRNPDGTVIVQDPATSNPRRAFDISADGYEVFLDVETQELGHRLQALYDFIYVTGARSSTMLVRAPILDFADAIILENGGAICGPDLEPNREWFNNLEPERKWLTDVADQLEQRGWILNNEGRLSGIRVRQKDNPSKSPSDFDKLCRELALPAQLKKTFNLGNLDIIPLSAGKENAVRFLMQRRGLDQEDTIGIGDDLNDLEFLSLVGKKFVLRHAPPQVLQLANAEGWYISTLLYFDGINEIMNLILSTYSALL